MKNNCENCGNCCKETEMIVSKQDIDLIKKNCQNHIEEKDFFIKNKDNLYQLKNIKGYCIFFNKLSNYCTIYQYRPQGCRFYPLIFDFHKKKCIFDKDCPRTHLFYQEKQDFKNSCYNLKKFLKEQLDISIN